MTFKILIKNNIFSGIFSSIFLIKYMFLMSEKGVNMHPRSILIPLSPLLVHYTLFIKLIKPIVVLVPINM